MNKKPMRGRELLVYINRKKARGILSLCIKKNTERAYLKEYLCERPYDTPVKRETYLITLTSLLPLPKADEEPFAVTVCDGEETRYEDCRLTEKKEEIAPDDYIRITYVIESARRRKGGCVCEG